MNGEDGLQAERTAMAWQRTALGLGGVSALLLHHAGGRTAPSVPGAAGLLAALVVLLLVEARYLRRDRDELENSPMGVGPVRGIAAVTVLLSLSAVIVVLAERG